MQLQDDHPAETFLSYQPQKPLSDFVEMLWYAESTDLSTQKERVLPTGTVELIIRLYQTQLRIFDSNNTELAQKFSGAVVCGAQSKYFVIDKSQQDAIIGVHFKPGGAFPFFGVPACELEDSHVSLSSLWGLEAESVRDQLSSAKSPLTRFQILEDRLMAAATRPLTRHLAVNFALKRFQNIPQLDTIESLAEKVNLSKKRLIDVFHNEVGLTPKLFCRVRRFQEVLRLIPAASEVDWADVALNCGYFDQAHFIRDFRAFSGLNPTTYLRLRTNNVNHVLLDQKSVASPSARR